MRYTRLIALGLGLALALGAAGPALADGDEPTRYRCENEAGATINFVEPKKQAHDSAKLVEKGLEEVGIIGFKCEKVKDED